MSYILQHKLVVALVVVVILGIGWYALSGSSAPASTLTTTPAAGNPVDQNLVSTLLALRSVKLDATIFSDPAFVNLRDFSTQIIPEPVGRTNPFAPLSAPALSPASATNAPGAKLFAAPRP